MFMVLDDEGDGKAGVDEGGRHVLTLVAVTQGLHQSVVHGRSGRRYDQATVLFDDSPGRDRFDPDAVAIDRHLDLTRGQADPVP